MLTLSVVIPLLSSGRGVRGLFRAPPKLLAVAWSLDEPIKSFVLRRIVEHDSRVSLERGGGIDP